MLCLLHNLQVQLNALLFLYPFEILCFIFFRPCLLIFLSVQDDARTPLLKVSSAVLNATLFRQILSINAIILFKVALAFNSGTLISLISIEDFYLEFSPIFCVNCAIVDPPFQLPIQALYNIYNNSCTNRSCLWPFHKTLLLFNSFFK